MMVRNSQTVSAPTSRRRSTSSRLTHCRFVGSFPALSLLPKDRLPQIALAGRSNVGKSTLLNSLVGQKGMAKVSATPGKTRALNFFLVNEKFYLVDLPGYGYAKVAKSVHAGWGEMIETYLTKAEHLVGLILLLDSRRDLSDDDLELLEWLSTRSIPVLCAVTKADKVNRDQLNRKIRQVEKEIGVPALAFSALKGTGKNELVTAVLELIKEYSNR
jgi:GTP-binding protein